jgi:hypothetical protein
MARPIEAYLEIGDKKVFAGAIDWPGWCRSGKTEDEALERLAAYGERYRRVASRANIRFAAPRDAQALEVVERLKGNATTDFGAPAMSPRVDDEPTAGAALKRLMALREASWHEFDAIAAGAKGAKLRTGPRGGGRSLTKILSHVEDAEESYLSKLGSRHPPARSGELMEVLRSTAVEAIRARAADDPLHMPNKARTLWSPRYYIRRSAWHALDHAWEIQDRAGSARA